MMPNLDISVAPNMSRTGNRLSRSLDPRRWRLACGFLDRDGSAVGFGARLFVTVAVTFVVVGAVGYALIDRQLNRRQVDEYAAIQRADARGFEHETASVSAPAGAVSTIDRLLDAIARRPGTLEALLIDRHHIVRAAGEDHLVGTFDSDPRIDAALEHGKSYAGHEGDTRRDLRNFEFVVPVDLPSGRYAYEVSYSHAAYDARLSDIQTTLVWVGLLALFGGGLVFYLVGGRALMRDHRIALQRSTRDGLTDLPNQRAFQDEFPAAISSAVRYGDSLALALLDVDDFKFVNDRHGHPHGDAVLKAVAEILGQARPADRPYRVGGDEFALMLAHSDAQGSRAIAQRLERAFENAAIKVSIGVSVLHPGCTPETLRAEADGALYEAKRHGGGQTAHFQDIREQVAVTTSEERDAVRALIDEGRLTTVFQPIWDLQAENLLGVEALTRPDPSYGLSGPAEAFDIAEQIGKVHELDVLCVNSALRAVPDLQPGVLLFLNLAPQTLDLDAEGNDWLRAAVEQAGLTPQRVVIEVTERFGGRTAAVIKCLTRLREQGFQTALDDVGTGNSGLEMLRSVGAEFVKLDRSIVTGAPSEPAARAVLMAMATFARQTGAFVIAEGIEDQDTLQFLRSIDTSDLLADTIIQGGQGYGLGRPSPNITPPQPDALQHTALQGASK
jgi:diguanylate cyclase (GGDEF)-like protein